jgi:hypothetical protein
MRSMLPRKLASVLIRAVLMRRFLRKILGRPDFKRTRSWLICS